MNNEVRTIEDKLERTIEDGNTVIRKLTKLSTEYEGNNGLIIALVDFHKTNGQLLKECLDEINRLNGR